jgi:hypothetical protein
MKEARAPLVESGMQESVMITVTSIFHQLFHASHVWLIGSASHVE